MKIIYNACLMLVLLVVAIVACLFLQFPGQEIVLQILLFIDLALFLYLLYSMRNSLKQIETITDMVHQIKNGLYGQLSTKTKDEIKPLMEQINSLSSKIKENQLNAKNVEKEKNEFLAMITHELKTPLVPIRGYADILLKGYFGQLNENQRQRAEIIKASSESLLELISDLLDAQKLEVGQLKMKADNYNIKSAVERAISIMASQAMTDKIQLLHTIKDDIFARFDEDRIVQVLTNLIKNSIKATEPTKGIVEVFVTDSISEVNVSVKDNGRGISKDSLDKIFRKFYQVDTSSTREKGGSGLGLAICKGIVESHRGKISVQSELGQGTTFTFSIPKNK
ncbi:MAG: sensor histidine kinase [Nitrosopumilaceae archaeon]